MNHRQRGLIVFHSTQGALATEQFFKGKGFAYEMAPTPREITASCGLSLRFLMDQWPLVEEELRQAAYVQGVYQLQAREGKPVWVQIS